MVQHFFRCSCAEASQYPHLILVNNNLQSIHLKLPIAKFNDDSKKETSRNIKDIDIWWLLGPKLTSTKVTNFWTTRGVSPPGTTGHSIGANRFDRSQTLLTFGGFKVARFSLVVDKVIIEMYRIA